MLLTIPIATASAEQNLYRLNKSDQFIKFGISANRIDIMWKSWLK